MDWRAIRSEFYPGPNQFGQSVKRTTDNSPAVHCWGKQPQEIQSVKRTAEEGVNLRQMPFQSSVSRAPSFGTRSEQQGLGPSSKLLGYYLPSVSGTYPNPLSCKAGPHSLSHSRPDHLSMPHKALSLTCRLRTRGIQFYAKPEEARADCC
jgi:hypothetical protein